MPQEEPSKDVFLVFPSSNPNRQHDTVVLPHVAGATLRAYMHKARKQDFMVRSDIRAVLHSNRHPVTWLYRPKEGEAIYFLRVSREL